MSTAMTHPTQETVPVKKKGRLGLVIGLAMTLGLAGFVGMRVRETLADRSRMEAAHAADAKAYGRKDESDGKGGQASKRAGGDIVRGQPIQYKPVLAVTGTLAPVQEADIGFKMPGRLLAVKVKVGDAVKAGQLLASIDASEMSAQAAIASAGVRTAEVALDMAKDAQRRTDSLFDSKSISEAERTSAAQRVALSAAQLEQARAQARLASVSAANTRVTAPFAGFITRAPAGIGKIVQPGEPLFHLDDTSILKLNATLSEEDARLVEVGASVAIEGAENTLGKVITVLGSLDPQTRRVPIVAEVQNQPSTGLRAGAFVRAKISAAQEIAAIKLPASALRAGSQDDLVLVKDGKAHLVRVAISITEDGSLIVRQGLTASDDVLLSPTGDIREGDLVPSGSAPGATTATPSPAH